MLPEVTQIAQGISKGALALKETQLM